MAQDLCPVWVGYLLANPLRKLVQDPDRILAPYVKPGMTVLDVGPAMGFFSLPMARMVGPNGKVVCVDLQKPMLERLARRAAKAGLGDRIETHGCSSDSLGLGARSGGFDFALAFAVVHEIPQQGRLFTELAELIKPGGHLLVSEPSGHVRAEAFAATIALAEGTGFAVAERPTIRGGRSALLARA